MHECVGEYVFVVADKFGVKSMDMDPKGCATSMAIRLGMPITIPNKVLACIRKASLVNPNLCSHIASRIERCLEGHCRRTAFSNLRTIPAMCDDKKFCCPSRH